MSNDICTPESAMNSGKDKSRKLTEEGINLIKSSESCVLEAYPDPASPLGQQMRKSLGRRTPGWANLSGEPWTIGWGSTGLDHFNLDENGKPTKIKAGLKWTQAQADERKKQDLEKFCAGVDSLVTAKISDNAFSALVSFAYNCGLANLKGSTLLKKVNEGKMTEAADEFLKWNKAQGKVLPGLTTRRSNERALFLKPDQA
jgi:lysozyme